MNNKSKRKYTLSEILTDKNTFYSHINEDVVSIEMFVDGEFCYEINETIQKTSIKNLSNSDMNVGYELVEYTGEHYLYSGIRIPSKYTRSEVFNNVLVDNITVKGYGKVIIEIELGGRR